MRKLLLLFPILFIACQSPIEKALQSDSPAIQSVMQNIAQHEVQILFTQIDSTETGVRFTDHSFQVNANNYFYPASTVKLPMAVLATEYVTEHPELDLDTPYTTKRDTLVHSIADDIRQIFAVSDNEAYNRLYELLGRDYVNTRLRKKGLTHTTIHHRLSTSNAAAADRDTLKFFPSYEGDLVQVIPTPDTAIIASTLDKTQKGIGYKKERQLIENPMDFSEKNFFSLEDQHNLMKRLFFKNSFKEKKRFLISPTNEIRLKKAMATLPRDAKYDPDTYYDGYVKFFMYGDTKNRIPEHIKIYNKVGYAYGTLTESAYIVDQKENVQFLLSATILVNQNGIFNDDTYEYELVGIPFLAELGRVIHHQAIEHK